MSTQVVSTQFMRTYGAVPAISAILAVLGTVMIAVPMYFDWENQFTMGYAGGAILAGSLTLFLWWSVASQREFNKLPESLKQG